MATREAAVRLSLKAQAFQSGLKQAEVMTARSGAKMGAAIAAPMKAGAASAASSIKTMFRSVAGSLKSVTKIGGALAIGSMIKNAVDLQGKFRDIAFQVSKTGEHTLDWKQAQELAQAAASKTGRTTEEMADAFSEVFGATGNLKFSQKALESIGTAATASGKDVGVLADVAATLQRKFGITAEELPEALAQFVEKTDVGGKSLDEMGNKFKLLAGEASDAGFKGKAGLSQLLGVMIDLDSDAGEKLEPGFKRLFQILKKGGSELKTIEKSSGLKFDADTTGLEKIRSLLGGKGRVAIEAKLEGDVRKVFDGLAKPFDEAFKKAKSQGKDAETATKEGLAAFDAAMTRSAKSSLTFAKLQDEAAKRIENDPAAKMRQALEPLQQAFAQPEMIGAINSLAKNLPELAKMVAKVVDFTVKNPTTAAAGFVGAKVGLSFAGGAISDVGSKIGTKAAAAFAQGPGIASVGKSIGRELVSTATAAGPWKTAGGVIGVAAAALIGVELGKKLSKATVEKDFDAASASSNALSDAALFGLSAERGSASRKTKQEAIAKLSASIKAEKERSQSFSVGDGVALAAGGGLGLLVKALAGKDLATGGGELDRAEAQLATLKSQLENTGQGGDKAGQAMERTARAAENAAKALEKLGTAAPGGDSKGPLVLGPVVPGSAPRGR